MVSQQRAVLRPGEPHLERVQIAGGEQVFPLVVRQGRAVAAGIGAHHRVRRADADEPRGVGNSGGVAFQLDEIAQVRRSACAALSGGQRHQCAVAEVLQKRLGLGGQTAVRLGALQRCQDLFPPRTGHSG